MAETTFLEIPWMPRPHAAIVPVFLPFQGCGHRCAFCAQDRQSGVGFLDGIGGIQQQLDNSLLHLHERRRLGKLPAELAFYGGTFTGLAPAAWRLCLEFAASARESGLITGIRCSTRPDCLPDKRLEELAEAGCAIVELGVQSFSSEALAASARGYGRQICIDACARLQKFGLGIGIHLMPGMPGVDAATFLEDVDLAILNGAQCLRLHPCLVLRGTPLEDSWRNGCFMPWSLGETINALARALLKTQVAGIPVIRIGLAPEDTLEQAVLAGPRHPSLGGMAMGEALFLAARNMVANLERHAGNMEIEALFVPENSQGYFWGCKGALREKWRQIGITATNLFYWKKNSLGLRTRQRMFPPA